MTKAKKKINAVIRTEEQLLAFIKGARSTITSNSFWTDGCDIYYNVFDNKFWFATRCIDRRLMIKLLKENKVKLLLLDTYIKDNAEFLIHYVLGAITDATICIFITLNGAFGVMEINIL